MIQLKTYHRPTSLEEALGLLARPGLKTVVLAGGTTINAHLDETVDEVLDLQALGLDEVDRAGDRLRLGAMVRLQTIVEADQAPDLLREAARREGPNTLRNAATLGGVLAGADWESELLAALLVLDCEVEIQFPASDSPPVDGGGRGGAIIPLPDFLAGVPAALQNGLVTAASVAIAGKTASARVARTPADRPIVAALGRLDAAGRIHLALCGVARTPRLVAPDEVEVALDPPGDFRGSSEYRRQMASVLARRVLASLREDAR